MGKLINDAQSDTNIKVILLHGGKYFSSGNNIQVLAKGGMKSKEEKIQVASQGIF